MFRYVVKHDAEAFFFVCGSYITKAYVVQFVGLEMFFFFYGNTIRFIWLKQITNIYLLHSLNSLNIYLMLARYNCICVFQLCAIKKTVQR